MSHKLSLPSTVFISLNIMIGTGIFLNTIPLAKLAGPLSPFIYAAIGLLMLPLALCIAQLLKIFPGGSFYTYATNTFSPAVGFFCSWSYFTCKLASSTIMIHFATKIIQSLLPIAATLPTIALDVFIIGLFTLLNMFNMRAGSKIQYSFIAFKVIPISFTILSGLFFLSGNNLQTISLVWPDIFQSVPLFIYAFTGFEAVCSLSRHIAEPEKNAPRAIFIAYACVITILCLYQFFFYATLGDQLIHAESYTQAFPLLIHNIFGTMPTLAAQVTAFIQLAIASSALGGAYGILFSNNWNLFALAEHGHIFFAKKFAAVNRYGIPMLCITAEAFLCILYLAITRGENVPLQGLAALGSTIAYTISVIVLLAISLRSKANLKQLMLPILGTINCLLLLGFCINGLAMKNIWPLFAFTALLTAGMLMFYYTRQTKQA